MKRCPSCQSTLPGDYTHCPRDGSSLISVAEWTEGAVIRGKYRILGKVGEGGMASVYKAMHTRFNEVRALKVISPQLASDASFVRRFEQEAIVTRKLQHPNAVRVDDIDEAEDGRPFIVMEYVEGRSLKDAIEQEAPMPLSRVSAIIQQAAGALDAAHAVGLIHRDIKPGNIALARTAGGLGEQVKILDFGIAKLREAHLDDSRTRSVHMTLTGTGMMIGTPAYMSPEQARGLKGDQLDGRSDLYSLGVVMYQMLARELPLKADSTIEQLMAHLNTPPRPIGEVRKDIPPAVASVVMKCLEKDRNLRPSSGLQLVRELDAARRQPATPSVSATQVISRGEVTAPPASETTAAPRAETTASVAVEEPPIASEPERTSTPRTWLWVAIAVVVVAVVGGVAFLRRGQPEPKESAPPATVTTSPATTPAPAIGNTNPAPPPAAPESPEVNPPHPAAPATNAAKEPALRNLPSSKPPAVAAGTPTKPASSSHPPVSNAPPSNSQKAATGTQAPATQNPGQSTPSPAASSNTNPTRPANTTPAATSSPSTAQPPGTELVTVYRVGGGVSAPSIVASIQPDYTDEARRARKEGTVVLSLIVDPSGHARNLKVVSPLGYGLDEKAIEAAKQWRFQPGMKDGKPVYVRIDIDVEFRQY